MPGFAWVSREDALTAYVMAMGESSGESGLRDGGHLESASDRPRNKHAYEGAELAECAAAYAFGAFSAAPVEELVWVVDRAEGGCPDCDDNALAGPTPRGSAFPTGQVHPPAHAGCRCLVLPATENEAEQR